jgi:hypothetical protein
MRKADNQPHPEALFREKRELVKIVGGGIIAAAGLAAVFILHEVYLGFGVALVGSGIVPFGVLVDKVMEFIGRGQRNG